MNTKGFMAVPLRIQAMVFAVLWMLCFGALGHAADDTSGGFRVHSLFQSNMVLQRDKPVDVWGWSAPGDKVTVTFAGKASTGVAGEDRLWKVTQGQQGHARECPGG